jgi:pyruvate,water dikinase
MENPQMSAMVQWLQTVGMNDVGRVGGKNASLGEMLGALTDAGVSVPGGFATTADAFRSFLAASHLDDQIADILWSVDVEDVVGLSAAGKSIRALIEGAPLSAELEAEIRDAYALMGSQIEGELTVAVRSSATAEDLPDASFAGQQETFLNVRGIDSVLESVRLVFASLYNDRAIAYRAHKGFGDSDVAISVGVQHMVLAGEGASGVMFTMDTESGFDQVVFITSSFGLGELLVQGAVEPDEFYVSKVALAADRQAIIRRHIGGESHRMTFGPDDGVEVVDVPPVDKNSFSLDDSEVTELARLAVAIEDHYGRPMDIEWARDGVDG